MTSLRAVFSIIAEMGCPLYTKGERLLLSDKTLGCPEGKEVCLILVRDMTEILFSVLKKQPIDLSLYHETVFNCSGCRGLIKFALVAPEEQRLPEL